MIEENPPLGVSEIKRLHMQCYQIKAENEAEEAPDKFTAAAHSLEQTLVQVAEQIETFNMFLEELSREYLGYDGGE